MKFSALRTTLAAVVNAPVLLAGIGALGFLALMPVEESHAQCTHGVAIFKSCQGPKRSCATDADCPDTQCTDGVCDVALNNVTDCLIDLTHADTCGDTTKVTGGFDIQDFGGDNVTVPPVGNLPINAVFGNAVCCVGPSLPCFVGPAGSIAGIAAGETGCGALALPGVAAPGTIEFRQNTYVVQPNDPDPLPDQANVGVKDLCNVVPAGCSSGGSTVQFTAATDIFDTGGCISAPKGLSTPCEADGNLCTDDHCDGNGGCTFLGGVPCLPPSPPCEGGEVCDPQSGGCVPAPDPPDSTPCTDTDADACTIAGCDGLGSCDQQHITVPDCGGDHYKCYKSRADFPQRSVSLVDQFGQSTATVLRPDRFCNPVNKNNEGISDPDAHLNCYKIKEPRGPTRDVVVNNQFGELQLTTTRAHTLCVPAIKDQIGNLNDLNINHFKCYRVRQTPGAPGFTERNVQLADQFEIKATTVIKPFVLCNPVDKNGEGVPDPTNHITCYKIRDLGGQPPFAPQQPNVTDQFVVQDLQTSRRTECGRTRLLCVPSSKRIASPSGAFLTLTPDLLD